MIALLDNRKELYQWDTGVEISAPVDCSQVHFANKIFGRSIDVDVVDGKATIPDILLQSERDLFVWGYVGTADKGYTKISKTFKINRRNKPSDYVFTPQEQVTLEQMQAVVDNIEKMVTPEYINEITENAIDDYIAQNPMKQVWLNGKKTGAIHTVASPDNEQDTEDVIYGAYPHGENAVAMGIRTQASGNNSYTEGYETKVFWYNEGGHAEGYQTVVQGGDWGHAEGYKTTVIGNYAHAEGTETTAQGESSHAEGKKTKATGTGGHAEGVETEASGQSHAEGNLTIAKDTSHAEGYNTLAEHYSHAEGWKTEATGNFSHAQGYGTKALGFHSHAEGYNTLAEGQTQHVQGRFNIPIKNMAHIVGNGDSKIVDGAVVENRSNAHTLDWDGNAWYAGTIDSAGVILSSPNGTKFKITVNDNGEIIANEVTE